MSESERRDTWREILGVKESRNEEDGRRTRHDEGGSSLPILWGIFIASVLMGIPSGLWLIFTNLNWLITHIPIVQVLSDFVIASYVIFWGLFFASLGVATSSDLSDEAEKKAFILWGLSLFFVITGTVPAEIAYNLPHQLWVGLHNPFSPGGVEVTPVATSTGNATGLYLITLRIKVNGLPPNATLIVTNAMFYNPFAPVKCVLYRTNVNSTIFGVHNTTFAPTLPLTVHVKVQPAWVTNIDEVDLTFLCNNIPVKSVLITNYGNFTYSYPS